MKAVLPSSSDISTIPGYFNKFLQKGIEEENEEEEEISRQTLTLRQIRLAALELGVLQHTWRNNNVEAHRYSIGDIGHIPEGGDLNNFTVLCNIVSTAGAADLEIQHGAWGGKFYFDHGFVRGKEDLQPFDFPDGVKGYDFWYPLLRVCWQNSSCISWTVFTPLGTKQQVQIVHEAEFKSIPKAWRYLLDHGEKLGETYAVKPEDLILSS